MGTSLHTWTDTKRHPLNIVVEAAPNKAFLAAYTMPKNLWTFVKPQPQKVASLRLEYNNFFAPLTASIVSLDVTEIYQETGIADYLLALAKRVASEAHQIQIAVSSTSNFGANQAEKGKFFLVQAHQKSYYSCPIPYMPLEPLRQTDENGNPPLLNIQQISFYVSELEDYSYRINAYVKEKSPDSYANAEPIGALFITCNYPISFKSPEKIFYFKSISVQEGYQNCDLEINLLLIGEELARRFGGIAVEVDPKNFGFEWLSYLQSFRKWQVQPDERFCKRFPV